MEASFLGNIAVNNYKFIPLNRETNFGTSSDAKQFKVYFDGQEKTGSKLISVPLTSTIYILKAPLSPFLLPVI